MSCQDGYGSEKRLLSEGAKSYGTCLNEAVVKDWATVVKHHQFRAELFQCSRHKIAVMAAGFLNTTQVARYQPLSP
jgi:hypothetical protein